MNSENGVNSINNHDEQNKVAFLKQLIENLIELLSKILDDNENLFAGIDEYMDDNVVSASFESEIIEFFGSRNIKEIRFNSACNFCRLMIVNGHIKLELEHYSVVDDIDNGTNKILSMKFPGYDAKNQMDTIRSIISSANGQKVSDEEWGISTEDEAMDILSNMKIVYAPCDIDNNSLENLVNNYRTVSFTNQINGRQYVVDTNDLRKESKEIHVYSNIEYSEEMLKGVFRNIFDICKSESSDVHTYLKYDGDILEITDVKIPIPISENSSY